MRALGLVVVLALGCGHAAETTPPSSSPRDASARPDAAVPAVPARTDPPVVQGAARPTQVSISMTHGCARMSDDTMRCWGDNSFGNLGTGDLLVTHDVITPKLTGVVEVAVGYAFTCARLRDHTVDCFGNALDGEIGVASPTDPQVNHSITAFTPVPGLKDIVQISASMQGACALHADGTVSCWGDNHFGELGDGTADPRVGPVKVKGLDGVTAIAAGQNSCALRVDGSVRCWGVNGPKTAPAIAGVSGATAIAVGGGIACAVDGGKVHCWGGDNSGQLGTATPPANATTPTEIKGVTGASAVAADAQGVCAIAGKQLLCWGAEWIDPGFPASCLVETHNEGREDPEQWKYCPTPTAVPGIADPTAVAVSQQSACAIAGGALTCWGEGAKPAPIKL